MIHAEKVVDAQGLACPMPIVKTKQAITDMQAGQVIEVQATDKGSKADLAAWSKSAGHQYLGTIEEGEVLKHYLRKSSNDDSLERKHPHTIGNQTLKNKIAEDAQLLVLDVREKAEYAFDHIPGAVSIPLGEIDSRMTEVDPNKNVYIVCRTGSRSNLAAQKLAANGYKQVYNVVPGMSEWDGQTDSN
ncbi:sulfurtransferase TusA family protein [Gracilibacillus caseinilyticus]|uniref:Sulfurtransferase TusA family protein n=1 Tax=Gracilibacillus caseinilyticus TaxID=2932256 RepID=A0ABY4F6R6_9BACI|nr:sulfurtransferase TusA family protein [Gracilibacillus caseinilyticus]UOQ50141.1 sulfurtransferase TusA family protein [Gracilibacillus caseinilyticus]